MADIINLNDEGDDWNKWSIQRALDGYTVTLHTSEVSVVVYDVRLSNITNEHGTALAAEVAARAAFTWFVEYRDYDMVELSEVIRCIDRGADRTYDEYRVLAREVMNK